MPLLRQEIHALVRLWKVHTIRPQRNRPNAVTGQLWKLYHMPPDDHPQCGIIPPANLLQTLTNDVDEWSQFCPYNLHYLYKAYIL